MTCVNVCRSVQKVTPTAFLEGPDSMQHINAVLHDMWGMGCLVFFMLTNHRLYNITGGSPQDMAEGTRQRHAQRDLLFSVDSSLLTTGPALINAAEGKCIGKLSEKLDEQEYPVVRDWLVQLMHPKAGSRVTARAALEAGVVTAKSERLTSQPTLVSVSLPTL
ncbi:TPA: hypothetical protein ACH3X3_006752 [Trebouxia sp. C0006]